MDNVHGNLALQEGMSDGLESEGVFVCMVQTDMERKDRVSNTHFYWEKNEVWFDPAKSTLAFRVV